MRSGALASAGTMAAGPAVTVLPTHSLTSGDMGMMGSRWRGASPRTRRGIRPWRRQEVKVAGCACPGEAAKRRHGAAYRTPVYYLRLYRQRAELTQDRLAEQAGIRQHHLSEIENNKRVSSKTNAKKLAAILDCDYQKLL